MKSIRKRIEECSLCVDDCIYFAMEIEEMNDKSLALCAIEEAIVHLHKLCEHVGEYVDKND
jgi:hypothetical protein